MKNARVQAFTILELTIAMLIASLVIGMAYAVFTIVSRSYSAFNTKNNDMAVVVRLNELLQKDAAHAESITRQENSLTFGSSDRSVTYIIQPDLILRAGMTTDTFKVSVQELVTTFEDKPVTGEATDAEESRIDDVAFHLIFDQETLPFRYHKSYSSADLFQRKSNAVN
jgi:hypothetical protein